MEKNHSFYPIITFSKLTRYPTFGTEVIIQIGVMMLQAYSGIPDLVVAALEQTTVNNCVRQLINGEIHAGKTNA